MAAVSRIMSTVLLLVFAGDTALPALLTDPESGLPVCCRRDGKHHCAMIQMWERQHDNAGQSLNAAARKCSMFPKSPAASFIDHSAPPPNVAVNGSVASHPPGRAQTEVLYRISHSRACQKRGPPSLA